MAMENYSPSHPTDEVDLDNSPDDIKILSDSIGKSKFSESIEQPQVFDIIDRSKFSENIGKCNDYELLKQPIKDRSLSPEVRKAKSKSRSRSRSRKRRSKSRSRNRRSRSRNRTDRSRNRDREYNRRSTERKSHSKERRSRSKDRKPRSNERRSRSRERRSRSRNSRFNSRSRDSPNQYRSKEKKNDNIFSKMNELSNKSSEPVVKQKWSYDSDEDNSPKKQETMNVFEPVDRFDDMKPLVNFNESLSRVDDMKPLPRRNDFFNNRRGGNDQFRGFQRNRQWEPRNNSGRSNFQPRNDQRFNRNKFVFNDDDTPKWQANKIEDSPIQKMSWTDGKEDDKAAAADWGKPSIENNNDSPIPDKKGFAADSDEECGNWGKENKNAINEMLTAANIESQKKVVNPVKENIDSLPESKNNFAGDSDEEFGAWGNERKSQIDQSQPQSRNETPFSNRNETPFSNRNETPFSNRNETSFSNRNETSFSNRSENNAPGNDSDEEFGSWGKDRTKTRNFNQSNDSNSTNNQGDSFNQSSQGFYSHNQRQNFNRNDNNNNPRFQGRRGGNNNFNRFQRPNNQERFNNNNNNSNNISNSAGFNSNSSSFPTGSNYNNNSNFTNFGGVPPNLSQQPQQQQQSQDIMSQLPMQMPPYNFNPSQRPPQWPPMNNLNFPPMCNGQLPFNPLPMIPQMQFSQINQSQQQQQQTSQQQQSGLSIPNMMQNMSFIPPPPPSSQPTGINNSQINQSNNFNQSILPQTNDTSSNLLETIMTNVGLSSKSIRLQPDVFKPQPPQSNKNSVNDSLHNIIKSAASTVLSRLVESTQKSNNNMLSSGNISDSMSMSPPSPSSSPPPPLSKPLFSSMSNLDNSEFILPPLPNYSDVLKPMPSSFSGMTGIASSAPMPLPPMSNTAPSNKQLSTCNEISEEKRNRSDFDSKSDWQERIALEVKNFLRPAYMSKKITKSDYKEIMKRCVTKISRSGVTEINTEKIEKFVLSYVDKYQKFRRGKQHGVVSSSEHELVM